jgi:hypothetical protein
MNSRHALVPLLLSILVPAQLVADSAPGRLLWSAQTGG